MRWSYFFAAILCALSLAVHVFVIAPEHYDAVMAQPQLGKTAAVLSVVWHLVTGVLGANALALFWAAVAGNPRARPIGFLAGSQLLMLGGLYLAGSWFWHHDIMALPYWTLVLPAGLFAFLAAW